MLCSVRAAQLWQDGWVDDKESYEFKEGIRLRQTWTETVSYRVVAVVAGNSEAVTLKGLKADTQYQVTVAAVWGGKKYRSRPIVFRTLGTSILFTTT